MSIYICPVCEKTLKKVNNTFKCDKGHSFDISAKGAVNLLLSNTSRTHGDNKLMILARHEFLNKGYYKGLSDAVNNIIIQNFNQNNQITGIDAGCGEGYYTKALADSLKINNFKYDLYGFDISKEAIKTASLRKDISFAVSSIYNLPVKNNCADFLINIFAPFCNDEFARILKNDGLIVTVIPGRYHLYSLKKILYDTPYENDELEYPATSFNLVKKVRVNYKINLQSNADIKALFSMTPYYYRTGIEQAKRLDNIDSLDTELDFIICIKRKAERT